MSIPPAPAPTQYDRRTYWKVDIGDLLFTPERDYLVKNNGQKYLRESVTFHMIEAYHELLSLGGVEFIFVPVQFPDPVEFAFLPEAIFNHLFSTLPFPTVPFSDLAACGTRVVETFQLHPRRYEISSKLFPHWVIIDPTNEVVMWRARVPIFKLFGGAEPHPLSNERIQTLLDEHQGSGIDPHRCEDRKRLIGQWDQLLASPTRDFLLSSDGDKVPISSLKGKVVGLYFCENVPHPPSMKMIDKAYRDAKLRGYDLEIVQINFHYKSSSCFQTRHVSTEDMLVQKCNEKTSWLTLPFRDPSCRKLQRILACNYEDDLEFVDEIEDWGGDHLVIVDPRQTDDNGPRFEFSGIEIFRQYGIEDYPFTRRRLYEIEREKHEREGILKFQLKCLLRPGECHLTRPGSDLVVDASELSGKRVIVLFADQYEYESGGEFVSMLESKYRAQLECDVIDEIKFEVVFLSTEIIESDFSKCVEDMPWLVHRFDPDFARGCGYKAFGSFWGIAVVAFDEDGELVAKKCGVQYLTWEHSHNQEFPFISDDTELLIRSEVIDKCALNKYYCLSDDE